MKIGEYLCFPRFKCKHLANSGLEQLKKDLHRYRLKEVLIQLFSHFDNYDATDKLLQPIFFAEKSEGVRIIWAYIDTMCFDLGGEQPFSKYKSAGN